MGQFCTYEQLRRISRELRDAGRKTVLVGGHFDLLHVGHAAFLAESRCRGDALLVYVPDDRSTSNIKGPGRPVMPAFERAHLLAALASTDYVTIVPYEMTADNIVTIDERLIREIIPAVYICVDGGSASSARLSILRRTMRETEIVAVPPQSLVWSSTRIARALTSHSRDGLEGFDSLPAHTSTGAEHAALMAHARGAAESSRCPLLQVGAAVIAEGSVVATGMNAPPDALACWCPAMTQPLMWSRPPCAAIHAETRAILAASNAHAPLEKAELYVTHSPCLHCAKLIAHVGIRNVVYEHEYASSAGRTVLQMAGVRVIRWIPT